MYQTNEALLRNIKNVITDPILGIPYTIQNLKYRLRAYHVCPILSRYVYCYIAILIMLYRTM